MSFCSCLNKISRDTMRLKYLLSFVQLIIFFNSVALAQLSGIKTIPGDYATIESAIAALNSAGVGSGGVTFNVAADYTESITAPILLTATGTSSNPVVFQKNGIGANPKVTRTDAGTVATSTLGGQGDAVIIIQGSDYVTFEGGRHENITITGNTVQGVFVGIILRGFNHTSSPYNFYDQNFIVGENGAGNTLQNFGGNAAQTSYGIYLIYHNNADVSHNTINNTAGGGSNFTSTGYGIFHSTSNAGNGTYNNNDINLSSNTGQLRGISSGTAGIATLVANNNTIRLSQAGTNEASCIYFELISAGSTVTINNNTFNYGTFASTSTS